MARDYLAIQATSVACKQAFFIIGNTIIKIWNWLSSKTIRASLYAKSWIDNNIEKQIGDKWFIEKILI